MPKNYLLIYSEQLATNIELLCQNIKAPSNTLFQIRKSSSSIYANIREANYGQSIIKIESAWVKNHPFLTSLIRFQFCILFIYYSQTKRMYPCEMSF